VSTGNFALLVRLLDVRDALVRGEAGSAANTHGLSWQQVEPSADLAIDFQTATSVV
jgi:hypothetical protein